MATSGHFRMASMLSLEGGGGRGASDGVATRRQSCVPNLPSPSVHVPSISARVGNGFPRGGGHVYENGSAVANGGLALAPAPDDLEGGVAGQPRPVSCSGSALRVVKRICSDGVLSAGSTGSGSSGGGAGWGQYWMLIVTPIVTSFSVALVIAAVAGPQWLLTEEKIPNGNYNGTMNYNRKDDGVYLTKYTKSSLWMLCSKIGGATAKPLPSEFQCSTIDYFPLEDYNPDPNDSTNVIPYTVTHSSPFFLTSNLVLVVAYVLFLLAMCSSRHKICYFVAGVLFIIAGLLMLIGLIMFISILKAEIGSKLRPRSSLQAPMFSFRYGQSFLLYVFGFIITELSGVLNVLIYSNLHQLELNRSQTYPTYQSLSGNYYNVPSAVVPEPAAKSQRGTYVPGRFYFSGDDCAVHRFRQRQSLVKSLNELYTEPAPEMKSTATSSSPPEEEDISAPSRGEVVSGRLTRSVSTCTDIEGRSEENLKNICGISKQYLTRELSKEKLFNEFCKKVGPRPKPKNIYYIEDDGKGADGFQNVFVIEGNNSDDDKFKRKRRNSMMDGAGDRGGTLERKQRIRSDNSLDQVHAKSTVEGIGQRFTYDMRQTLPRNFLKKNHRMLDEHQTVEDDRGGFSSMDDLVDSGWNRRISASGLLEPVRLNSSQNDLDATVSPHNPYHRHSQPPWPKIIPKSTTDFISMQQKYLHVPSSPSYVEYAVRPPPAQTHRSYGDLTSYQPPPPPLQYARIQHPHPHPVAFFAAPPAPFTGKFSPVFDLDRIECERRKSHSQLFLNSTCQQQQKQQQQQPNYDYVNGTAV
ncbi:hypothetical protein pipiens_005403 [Culex pipiens pipiens]|uniref:Voltage-dependent calcium channel gamma-5 subunit n=1 Tax=Culex pipiens pipiens TaxID=38569 RepID=A0ABD1DX43_CULPP